MSDDIVERLRVLLEEFNVLSACVTKIEAERDAERERLHHERLSTAKAEVERDALRALLREARKLIARCDPQDFFNMLARIDALLNKGGGDET